MHRSLIGRVSLAIASCCFVIAVCGCTYHDVVLEPQGKAFTTDQRSTTIGHINTTTVGFTAAFIFPFMPGSEYPDVKSNSLQYTYNKMAEEASIHGANKLLDIHSGKSSFIIMGPFLQLFFTNMTANMTK